MKSEIEVLKNQLAEIKTSLGINTSTQDEIVSTDKNASAINKIVPNPFSNETEIQLSVPNTATSVAVKIADEHGKLVKTIQVTTKGNTLVKLNTAELSSGHYFCTLVVDGVNASIQKMSCIK